MKVDTFGDYVQHRLDIWGREFALSRDWEYLGHQSKNMLQILIEHKGEMPGKTTGFKPLEVPLDALQIERIVSDVARDQPAIACVLRAYYCGSGRRKVERFETANLLLTTQGLKAIKVRQYMVFRELGVQAVRASLVNLSTRQAA